MRLQVRDSGGRAQLELVEGRRVVGVANMSWAEYREGVRAVALTLREKISETLATELGALLWQDVLSTVRGNDEIAKERLLALGWGPDKLKKFAEVLASKLVSEIAELLPDHK